MCLVLIISCFAISTLAATSEQYPAYIWSQKVKGKKLEIKSNHGTDGSEKSVLSSNVSDEIKNILETTEANSFILYHRPGMTTKSLVNTLVTNYKIGNLLRESVPKAIERSFTDVSGASLSTDLAAKFSDAKTVVIDSKQVLETLKKEFETAPKPFINKQYIIELPYESDAAFDEVVYQIERAFGARTLGNHVSILAGSETSHRSLQEVDVDPTDDEPNTESSNDTPTNFLTSGILTQILVFLPLVFLLVGALNQMYNIKTPTLFVEKGIDFGRIEK